VNRSIRQLALMLGIISAVLAVAIQAAEEKVPEARGKIVVYAQFLSGVQTAGEERGLHIVDPATNTWTKIAESPAKNGVVEMARFRVSPDGNRIAHVTASKNANSMQGSRSIWVVSLDGKDRRSIYTEPDKAYLEDEVTWSPDGKQLATILKTWTTMENGSVTPTNPVSASSTSRIAACGSYPILQRQCSGTPNGDERAGT
jgi:dipeptidyl aminopeptidase/acylaminoacyl peptidase